ncbi:unnamed protein product [Pedinophyceae sp. YPF-701]|nr:unnamed protein product [Pedinophyceae sp. YPF-701]
MLCAAAVRSTLSSYVAARQASRHALSAAHPRCQHWHQHPRRQHGTATPAMSTEHVQHEARLPAGVAEQVGAIHASGKKLCLFVTGGAAQAISWLLCVPGASSTIVDAQVPYSHDALVKVLGTEPTDGFSSRATASAMARAAYLRAVRLSQPGDAPIGVGAACALVSRDVKKGDHRAWIATYDGRRSRSCRVQLQKGLRNRVGEDAAVSVQLLSMVADACNTPAAVAPGPGAEILDAEETTMSDPIAALLSGGVSTVELSGGQVYVDAPREGLVLLPGSFNPLHQGHEELLRAAEAACAARGAQRRPCFEIAVANADKGTIARADLEARLEPFLDRGLPVVLTRAPLFTQKAALFKNTTFVVGHDTAARLVMTKYYRNSHEEMVRQFVELDRAGCNFLVGGRVAGDDCFKTLDDVDVPSEFRAMRMFEGIPEDAFRVDISSTELRQQAEGDA